jgi:hypothetical protein
MNILLIQVGIIRGQQRTQAADDEETSYDGSRRRAGPADNWDGPSSSRGDPGEKWRRVGTDITDVDFGGNGSSGEDSEGNFIFENSSQKIRPYLFHSKSSNQLNHFTIYTTYMI